MRAPPHITPLRVWIPVAIVAILSSCRGDNSPPTATKASVTDEASFSEQSPFSDGEAGGSAPRGKHLRASAVFTHSKGRSRQCIGADGDPWGEDEVTFTGTSAGDPELTGRIELKAYDIYSFVTNAGPSIATVIVRDPTTGSEKARGDYTGWGPPGDLIYVQGTVLGRVRGEDGGKLVAGWTVSYRADGVFGEFDGTPIGPVPAGTYSGRCSGPWVYNDNDVPPPAVGIAAAKSSARLRSGALRP
jgi:hypothetical protein